MIHVRVYIHDRFSHKIHVYVYIYIIDFHTRYTHTTQVVDESEMVEYRGRLEQWAARQEEGRHTFTVSHPTQARRSRNTDKVYNTVHVTVGLLPTLTYCSHVCISYAALTVYIINVHNIIIELIVSLNYQGHPQTIPKQQSVFGSTDRPRSSDSDLRGSRYQVLPPIGARNTDASYNDWKKQSVHVYHYIIIGFKFAV